MIPNLVAAVDWPSLAFGFSVGGLLCFALGWRLGRAERTQS